MRAPWSYLPAVPPCLGIIAGIIVCQWLPWAAAAASGAAVFALLYLAKRHYMAYFFGMLAAGAASYAINTPPQVPDRYLTKAHTYTARIVSAAERPQGMVYTAKLLTADGRRAPALLCRVTVNSYADAMEPGCVCSFKGKLQPATSAAAVVPGMPDPDQALRRQQIGTRVYLMPGQITLVRQAGGYDRVVNNARRGLYNAVVTAPISAGTASFLTAVLLGDDSLLIPDHTEAYRSVGVAHLLALSGMHVGIIAAIFGWLMLPIRGIRRMRVTRRLLAAVLVWIYVAVVGASPSVIRAAIMITVMLGASMVQRSSSAWNSLALSVALMLLIWPHWLFTAGFQLSVAAVISILLFSPLIPLRLKRWPPMYTLVNLVVIPIAAILGTGIVSAYYFSYFPVYFLIANIVTGIFFPFIVGGGFVLMLLNACGWGFGLLGGLVDVCYKAMDAVMACLSGLPHSTVGGIHFSAWLFVPYTLAVVLLAEALRNPRQKRWWACFGSAASVTAIVALAAGGTGHSAEAYLTARQGRTLAVAYDRGVALARAYPADTVSTDSAYFAPYLSMRDVRTPVQRRRLRTAAVDITDNMMVRGSTVVMVADSTEVATPVFSGTSPSRRYWLVTDGYRGDITALQAIMAADTVIFGADVHPSRLKRWQRQCADSIPHISLRTRGVKL